MKNYYKLLGIERNATLIEIKKAYRLLAKKHHPDTGGSKEKFLAIQNAWETLNDPKKKLFHDKEICNNERDNWSFDLKEKKNNSTNKDQDIKDWFKKTYMPINRLLNQIIKPLNSEIKKLSADPYDDKLMDDFCIYLNESRKKIEKVLSLYKAQIVPSSISSIALDLYHCFSQVQDALDELTRYTEGYVDDYLFDGKQMMKEAKTIQSKMQISKKNISL
tara:strand:- start:77 stop:733 length:657 start_codon:yes stop_codon:yes gene_type:complete